MDIWDLRGRIAISIIVAFFLVRLFGEAPNIDSHTFYLKLRVEQVKSFLGQKAAYTLPQIFPKEPFTFTGGTADTPPTAIIQPTTSDQIPPSDIPPTSGSVPTAIPTTIPTAIPTNPDPGAPTRPYVPPPTNRPPQATNTPPPAPTATPTRRPTTPPTATPRPTSAPSVQCASTSSESYDSISVSGGKISNAASHGDVNLALRSYSSTSAEKALIDINGPVDSTRPPQLAQALASVRSPAVIGVYRVNEWNFGSGTRGGPIGSPDVTMIGIAANPGETVTVPDSGYSIGSGKEVMVIYADSTRVTLKYMREDGVVNGYTVHLEDFCTDPNLVKKYNELNGGGRSSLPGLPAGKRLGTARSAELKMVIRDTGSFMDPRGKKNWWQGY